MQDASKSLNVGIHSGVDEELYHSLGYASSSGLSLIAKSPLHYVDSLVHKVEPTPAMIFGSAFHCAMESREAFSKKYCVAPEGIDRRNKAGKEAWAEFQAAHVGKTVLSKEDFEAIERMVVSIHSHAETSELLRGGKSEETLIWDDPVEGVRCKGRVDYLRPDGVIVDFKTTDNASEFDFTKKAFNLNYPMQSAFYSDALKHLTGSKLETYILLAVEKKSPYDFAIYIFDDFTVEYGRALYRKHLKTYAECMKAGHWPGYSKKIKTLTPPKWISYE